MTRDHVCSIYQRNLVELIEEAHSIHRENFSGRKIEAASLLSIKTGGCPENCSYCPQSAHYKTGVERTQLMSVDEVSQAANRAKNSGASRFCMGAAWRNVRDGAEFDHVLELVKEVRSQGLEVCCTLGMLSKEQAVRLKEAGLHFYNHNIDSSREHYSKVIQTRTYDDRLKTIQNVREAGLGVCTGGILGLGETEADRVSFIHQLATFEPQPESVTINTLVPFSGTPLESQKPISALEVVRVIATLRITNPRSVIRLSAGRLTMTEEAQFLCFYSGANSIFFGEKLLTSPNPMVQEDRKLLEGVGYSLKEISSHAECRA